MAVADDALNDGRPWILVKAYSSGEYSGADFALIPVSEGLLSFVEARGDAIAAMAPELRPERAEWWETSPIYFEEPLVDPDVENADELEEELETALDGARVEQAVVLKELPAALARMARRVQDGECVDFIAPVDCSSLCIRGQSPESVYWCGVLADTAYEVETAPISVRFLREALGASA